MSIIKQSSLFTLFLIIFSFIIRYYSVYNAGVDINTLSILLSVILTGAFGGLGFYLGQIKIQKHLTIIQLILSAVIVFFMSDALSNSINLYQVSWFAYAGVLFAISYIAAARGPKLFNK